MQVALLTNGFSSGGRVSHEFCNALFEKVDLFFYRDSISFRGCPFRDYNPISTHHPMKKSSLFLNLVRLVRSTQTSATKTRPTAPIPPDKSGNPFVFNGLHDLSQQTFIL